MRSQSAHPTTGGDRRSGRVAHRPAVGGRQVGGQRRRWSGAPAALLVWALLAVACGARLDSEQFALGVAQQAGRRSTAGAGAAVATGPQTSATTGPVAATGPTQAPTTGPTSQTAGTQAGGPPSTTAGGGEPQPGTTTGGGAPVPTDTRRAPPGGNGGATDVGVYEDRIVIANVADVSGAVPGLFEEVRIAVRAAVAMFTATEGTIYGRRIELLELDSRMDANGNRTAYLDACERAFAAVGSMSAFDQGVAAAATECGIPDLRTTALTPDTQGAPTVYPVDAMQPYVQTIGDYFWIKETRGAQDPDLIRKAGYLFIDGEVTRYQTGMTKEATERIGYQWPVYQQIDIAEVNYAPHVLRLKQQGIRLVAFQGAYQQAVKLAEAMRQQDYQPDIYLLQANVYRPEFLVQGGEVVEGALVPIVSVMLEEIDQHPELQRYDYWVQQVAPGKRATALGTYAWSSALLFFELAKRIGPELTRQKLLDAIREVNDWDGNGVHPPQEIGRKWPSDCQIFTQVRGGRFVRVAPESGFLCTGAVVDLRD